MRNDGSAVRVQGRDQLPSSGGMCTLPPLTQVVLSKRMAFMQRPDAAGEISGCWIGLIAGLLFVGAAHGQAVEPPALRAQADSLAAVADSLRGERALEAARATYRRARDAYGRVGDPGQAAVMTGKIGIAFYLAEDMEAARQRFLRAAEGARQAGNREQAANYLNNAGVVERRLGRYDEALTHIREAVQIHRRLGNQKQVASGRNNLANIQEGRGQFRAALQNLRRSLEVNRSLSDSSDVAMNLNNIGLVLRSQGQYDEALTSHQEALRIHREVSDSASVADALNNLGITLKALGRYDDAAHRYRESLRINRALGNRLKVESNLNNLAEIELERGQHAEALRMLQQALKISRAFESRADMANTLSLTAEVYRRMGAFDQADANFQAALRINRALGRRDATAETLQGMGGLRLAQGRYAAADSLLTEAVAITEALLQTASGADRRDYLAREAHAFQALVTARVRVGDAAGALRTFERGRARLLAERLAGQERPDDRQMPSVAQLQATVGPDAAAVLYANTDTRRPLTALVVTQDSIHAHEIRDSSLVRKAVARYEEALGRLRLRDEIVESPDPSLSLLETSKGLAVGAEGSGLTRLVRLYRHDLGVPSRDQVLSEGRHRVLGQYLYELLLAPLEGDLRGRDELIVVPDGALGYVPFETLPDWEGEYVIESRQVRYVQSLRVLRLLQQRPARTGASDGLLALGGAVYDAQTYAADTSDRTGAWNPDRRRTGAPWPNLPWSLREVQQLGRLASPSRVLTGSAVREDALHRMSADGTLRRYRVLHFATHGLVVPEAPARSALVLSGATPNHSGTSGRDGYLTMNEIATLSLDAEFVALSACQTGLGRIYRGSGVVSLAQAFLRAGADATAVSLWSVYDASTQVFMRALYRRVWEYGQAWDRALAETKRAFLDGDHGERLRDPRFWGPFVHYGHGGR